MTGADRTQGQAGTNPVAWLSVDAASRDLARTVRIFDTWELACDHLQSHLLTEPECRAWALVIPEIRDLVESRNRNRWAYSQKAKQTEGGAAQKLYDAFSQSVAHRGRRGTPTQVVQLLLVSSWKTVTVSLGTAGILMVVESWLKTAFLPGQGEPQAVREQQEQGGLRRDATARRGRNMRSGRPGLRAAADRDEQDQLLREQDWSDTRKTLFYGVFRPAVQFIRFRYHVEIDARGLVRHGDYGLLKDVLPPMSHLKYEDWLAVRQRAQPPGSGGLP